MYTTPFLHDLCDWRLFENSGLTPISKGVNLQYDVVAILNSQNNILQQTNQQPKTTTAKSENEWPNSL